jgi:hypothetical protein
MPLTTYQQLINACPTVARRFPEVLSAAARWIEDGGTFGDWLKRYMGPTFILTRTDRLAVEAAGAAILERAQHGEAVQADHWAV